MSESQTPEILPHHPADAPDAVNPAGALLLTSANLVDKVFSQGHGGVLLDQRTAVNLEDPATLNSGANPR